jgi:cysteine desulfurase/selenocysteine lyase
MNKFQPETNREDFPILQQKIHGDKKLVYLDSAASSQKPRQVIDAMSEFNRRYYANIHRGIHFLAEESTRMYETARDKIARFIGAENNKQVIFTRNTTESINLVAQTWGRQNIKQGDLILLTEMEHHSNLVPWYMLAEEKKCRIEFVKVKDDCFLDLDNYSQLLAQSPKLVAFTHMSNVLGTINPARKIIEMAHQANALALVDGAQSTPHFSVDVEDLNADFYAFSAHKMCGPSGIGILYGKEKILDAMPPFLGGGDMIRKVTFNGFKPNSLPYKFEAGTPAITEAIGFSAAVDYLICVGMDYITSYEKTITHYALNRLQEIDEVQVINEQRENRGGVISFTYQSVHPHDVAQILDSEGIAVRAGHHCAMPLHQRLDIPASTRASLYFYNNTEDVDALIEGLKQVKKIFG